MNIDNKFLLVCLLLIIVLLMSMSVEGKKDKCRDQNRAALRPKQLTASSHPLSSDQAVARIYRLYNLRASADVAIKEKVTASAKNSDRNGELGLETVMKDDMLRTRVRGICTEKYLCFNHKGRLVTKVKGRAQGPKCEFEEEFENGHSRLKSALNPSWYVGFNREGRPLHGSAYEEQSKKCPRCFQFYKTESTSKDIHSDNLLRNNFDFPGHNKEVGQLPPGLNANFFLHNLFPFTAPDQNSSSKEELATVVPAFILNSSSTQAPPHLRHGGHQNRSKKIESVPRHSKKSQRKNNRQHNHKSTTSSTSQPSSLLPPHPKFL